MGKERGKEEEDKRGEGRVRWDRVGGWWVLYVSLVKFCMLIVLLDYMCRLSSHPYSPPPSSPLLGKVGGWVGGWVGRRDFLVCICLSLIENAFCVDLFAFSPSLLLRELGGWGGWSFFVLLCVCVCVYCQ